MCEVCEKVCNLDDCMEKAHSKDDLPPLTSQNVVFKEIAGDLGEGPSYVGSQAFRRLISHLATTTQKHTWLNGCYKEDHSEFFSDCQTFWGHAGVNLISLVVQAVSKPSYDTCSYHAVLPHGNLCINPTHQISFVANPES